MSRKDSSTNLCSQPSTFNSFNELEYDRLLEKNVIYFINLF